MEFDDELVFFEGEIAALEVREEIVDPAETTALAATEKAGGFGERAPAAFTVSSNVRNEAMIFFFGPCTFVCVCFLTARGPSHPMLSNNMPSPDPLILIAPFLILNLYSILFR